jgi:hypothetical protein
MLLFRIANSTRGVLSELLGTENPLLTSSIVTLLTVRFRVEFDDPVTTRTPSAVASRIVRFRTVTFDVLVVAVILIAVLKLSMLSPCPSNLTSVALISRQFVPPDVSDVLR